MTGNQTKKDKRKARKERQNKKNTSESINFELEEITKDLSESKVVINMADGENNVDTSKVVNLIVNQVGVEYVASEVSKLEGNLGKGQRSVEESRIVTSLLSKCKNLEVGQSVFDHASTFTYLLKGDVSYGMFFSRNLKDFNVELTPRFLQPWYFLCKCLTNLSTKKGKSVGVWFLLDTFIPFVPAKDFMSEENAKKFVCKYWAYLFMESTLMIYSQETDYLWIEVQGILDTALPRPTTILEIDDSYIVDEAKLKSLIGLFILFIEHRDQTIGYGKIKDKITEAILSGIMCMMKRGNATSGYLERQQQALADETGKNIQMMTQAEWKELYLHVSGHINKDGMIRLVNRWEGYCRDESFPLHLRLSLGRAIYQGLATYRFIYEAMRLHTDFPWEKVFTQYPEDGNRFKLALQSIGDGKYCGFVEKNDLYKSTNFKSLGWVAWKLLSALEGKTIGAKQYAGFFGLSPINHKAMTSLIEKYIEERNVNILEDGFVASPEVINLRREIQLKLDQIIAAENQNNNQ